MRKQLISGIQPQSGGVIGERRLLADLRTALRSKLPPSWSVESNTELTTPNAAEPSMSADAVVTVTAPDGSSEQVIVELKHRLDPKYVPVVVEQLQRFGASQEGTAGLIVAPYLSPRTRWLLAERGLGYADSTGNLRLVLERPAVFIETEGAQSDPERHHHDRPLRSLKGPIAGRVVRALCDFRPPYGVQELAERSGTSLASVSRVCTFLDLEALIVRGKRGLVVDVKWPELIHRWTADYSFAKANTAQTFLEPRGLSALLAKLQDTAEPYSVTGSLAATGVAPIAAPRLATIYVTDIEQAGADLRLRPADAGANVILAEPFDAVAFDRRTQRDGIYYVAFSQVAADLLTSPGRGPSEGEELIRWMERHEDAWRV
jgi:hypothetical protein